jgi:hypothetical protein
VRRIFADSFYFFAASSVCDPWHAEALNFAQTYSGNLVTTEWVITEVADGMTKPAQRPTFGKIRKSVRENSNVTLVNWSDELF